MTEIEVKQAMIKCCAEVALKTIFPNEKFIVKVKGAEVKIYNKIR